MVFELKSQHELRKMQEREKEPVVMDTYQHTRQEMDQQHELMNKVAHVELITGMKEKKN